MFLDKKINETITYVFFTTVITVVSLLAYSIILVIGVPKEIGLAARYDLTPVLLAIALLLYPAYRQSNWIGSLASFSLTLVLFALPLSGLWNNGITEPGIIGGLLPWSDASGYYGDAKRLLEGDTFSVFSSRRPLFAGMLASLLGLTGQNLQVTLAILVLINAVSCFLLVREIQRSHGTIAGLIVLAILFVFYRRFAGTALTENLGLALGSVGLANLWRGTLNRQINPSLLGLFLLTLALNARAGAFFILPALIVWGAWFFRGSSRFSLHFLLGGFSVVLLGFILNSILLKTIGHPNGMGNSNFSYTFYGLLTGGNWKTVLTAHPELKGISDPELSRRIYGLAFEVLWSNPLSLVTGSLRAWNQFLFKDYAFSFVLNQKINLFLQFLSLVALLDCYRHRQEPHASMILIASFGVLVSVPFVPPWDAGLMRPYAATIPFLSVLPALGMEFIVNPMKKLYTPQVVNPIGSYLLLFGFSITVTAFIFVSPVTIKLLSRTPKLPNLSCPQSTDTLYLRISPGSFINLVDNNSIGRTHLPNIRVDDFRSGLVKFNYPEIAKELTELSVQTTIMNAVNLKNWSRIFLIFDTTKLPTRSDIVQVCGKPSTNPTTKRYGFFYAESVKSISSNLNNINR